MSSKREYIQIQPTNLGNGVFGSRQGLPQAIFEIPKMPKMLNGKSVRLSGKFKLYAYGNQVPTNTTSWCADNPSVAPIPVAGDVYIDGRTGIHSCVDVLSIQNLEGATYTNIKNYNRLVASLLPLNESFNSYVNGIDSQIGGCGKEVTTAGKCDQEMEFSIPLLAGFLQGSGGIDLELVKGLRISLTLSADNYVCRNNKWRNPNSNGGTIQNGAYYQLSDLNLSFEAETYDQKVQEAMMKNQNGAWEYEEYASYYNVIQSNDHNATININTGRTLANIINLCPSSFLNNYNYNSQGTLQLLTEDGNGEMKNRVVMSDLTFTKGGLRVPLDFEVDSEESQRQGVASSQKNREELNAIRDVWSMSNFEKSLRTELSLSKGNTIAGGASQDEAKFNNAKYEISMEDKIQQFNLGINYDKITRNGLDFRGTPLGIRIQSVNPGVPFKPHSLFLFVKHKNTIVFNKGQVNMSS